MDAAIQTQPHLLNHHLVAAHALNVFHGHHVNHVDAKQTVVLDQIVAAEVDVQHQQLYQL